MRAAAGSLVVMALLAASPSAAGPQAPAPAGAADLVGAPIAEVRLVVAGQRVADATLLAAVETRKGEPFTPLAVRQSILHLMALDRFSSVTVDAEPSVAGVVVTYELTRLNRVVKVEFRGDLGLSQRALHAAVGDRYGEAPPAWRGGEIARALEALCHEHGFLTATATPVTEQARGQDRLALVFEMKAGPQATVASSRVDGAPPGAESQVLARLGVAPGSRYDRVSLDQAVARYVSDLRGRGFLEAKVATDVVPSPDLRTVTVAVTMTRGAAVAVSFRGDPLPADRRKEILALLQQGVLDQDTLENQERRIEDDLRAQGYRDAAAPFSRETAPNGRQQVVFLVSRGRQYRIASVDLTGCEQVPCADVRPVLKLSPGQWYVAWRADAAAAAVQAFYRQQGFRAAAVVAKTAAAGAEPTQVAVTVSVTEGPRTIIDAIEFPQGTALPPQAIREVIGSRVGGPFFQPQVDRDREAVLALYQNLGYLQATVRVPEAFSADLTRFTLRLVATPGPRILVDHVLIRGNVRTKAGTIDRAAALRPGMPLTMAELLAAQRRLSELGLFRKVEIAPIEGRAGDRRDILISVEEAPVNTIGWGGGLEGTQVLRPNASGVPEQTIEISPRGFFEIGRRNLWGKDRSVDLFVRGAIRSTDQFTTTGSTPTTTSSTGFHEYRVQATFREPRFMNLPIDVVVSGALDQAIRSSFDFKRQQMYVEAIHRFGRRLSVSGRYALGRTRLFNEQILPQDQLDVDRLFPRVKLSTVSLSAIYTTRDDAFDPTRGVLLAFDSTVAPRALGSEVGFIRNSWQSYVYHKVPGLPGAVFAGGARFGFAWGFPLETVDRDGQRIVIEQELPASERFFAGGDTSVRGFALDQLGASNVIDNNGVSAGGNGLVIFNAELRFPLWRAKSLGGAVFVDTGDVFARVSEISLGEFRTGAGVGIRWKSPVGPLRLDFAWKLHPITYGNGTEESRFAWYITIGQAF